MCTPLIAVCLKILDYLPVAIIAIKLQILLQHYIKKVANQGWLEQKCLPKNQSGGIVVFEYNWMFAINNLSLSHMQDGV